MGFHRHRRRPTGGALVPALLLFAAAAAADPGSCPGSPCILVEHDPALAEEAGLVVEILARRLIGQSVAVVPDGEGRHRRGDPSPGADPRQPVEQWIVHLRLLPSDYLLVTVSSPPPTVRESAVREIRRGADATQTARTVALVVEETVRPYLVDDAAPAPLGAGLAIIEPPEVGGVKAARDEPEPAFPRLRCLELGLAGFHLAAVDALVAGPRLRVEGLAAPRLTVSASLGWAGTASYSAAGITGTTSAVPIETLLGAIFLPGRVVELSAFGGFSVGFAVYRTAGAGEQRTDILFDPWFTLGLRAVLRIQGPWAVAVDGGAALVLVRDELRSGGRVVYLQDWVLPRLGLAVQLML